jgi:hypothetical protein
MRPATVTTSRLVPAFTPPRPAPAAGLEHCVLRCPRPDCGGRLFAVALDLEESAAVCLLCARAWPAATAGKEVRS